MILILDTHCVQLFKPPVRCSVPFTSTVKVNDTFADLSSIQSLIIVKCFASPASHEETVLQAKRQLKSSGQGIWNRTVQGQDNHMPTRDQVILFISVFSKIVLLEQEGWGTGLSFSSYLFCGAFCIECQELNPSIVSVSL